MAPTRWWFIDTAGLLSMAVDTALADEIRTHIGSDRVVIVDAVREELAHRLSHPDTESQAATALEWLADGNLPENWFITATDRHVSGVEVEAVQADIADGRPLKDDLEHWAESVIITYARKARSGSEIWFVSEDYRARDIASREANMRPRSIGRLLWERVQRGLLTAEVAAALHRPLSDCGRAANIKVEEFADHSHKGLGRQGRP